MHLEPASREVMMLLSLVVIGAFVLYVMNADERDRLRRRLLSLQVTVICLAAHGLDAGARLVRAFRARQFWARLAAAALMVIALASVAGWTLIRPPQDIRQEIEQLVSTETSITATYDTAVAQFRLGRMTAAALAQLIDRRIRPELHVVRMRVVSLEDVQHEQRPMLAKANEYLRLREESWQLRAAALHKRDMAALRRVETTERASLAALAQAVQAANAQ
jgi:hypothetical protein